MYTQQNYIMQQITQEQLIKASTRYGKKLYFGKAPLVDFCHYSHLSISKLFSGYPKTWFEAVLPQLSNFEYNCLFLKDYTITVMKKTNITLEKFMNSVLSPCKTQKEVSFVI